jgi:CRP-like cAMP-binding protein
VLLPGKELTEFHPEMNLFDALPAEDFKRLLSIARRENVEAGSALMREGGEADTLHVILDGKVKVFKTGESGEPMELATLGAGSVFGEMGVFDGLPASATIMAVEDSIVLQISRPLLYHFLQTNPDIAFTLMHTLIYILSNRLRRSNVHATSSAGAQSLASVWDSLLKD